MSEYVHFIRSFGGAGPSPNRSTGCDSCKIRRKKCPLRFDSEGRCQECQRLGIQCVRDHPPWLDDPDQLNSFRRTMRRTVKRNRQNRHRTSPRETVSGEMGTFVQPHEEAPHALCDRDPSDHSHSEATFVHNSHDRTGFIPGQTAGAAAQSFHQAAPASPFFHPTDGQIPFRITPYHGSRISLPTLPIMSTPNTAPTPPFPEARYHYPHTVDPANIPPHYTRVSSPDSQLQLFVNQLRHHYPRVRHVIIEADNDAQSINALTAEAARINRMTPMSSLMVSVLGCSSQAQEVGHRLEGLYPEGRWME